ncbi:cyclin ccl1 [Pyrenophora seminiperda CCB06]|uniref:Cyclin ccl1 n=1 Tax=Pyrenophora seminiperda CCB06 TaxID=1302712 RepID=A0A3M7M5N0_9PLEO|nr:cyclin ccl1 [Pyrenophora seminiperda CCB06]
MKLTEDDLYRTSTQYRNWSFTAAQLAAQRLKINLQATERVKANLARVRAQRSIDAINGDGTESGSGIDKENGSGTSGANTPNDAVTSVTSVTTVKEVDCLTADEELKIVDEFCERAIALGSHYSFPLSVVVRTYLNLPTPNLTHHRDCIY